MIERLMIRATSREQRQRVTRHTERHAEAARREAANDLWQSVAEEFGSDGHNARVGECRLAAVAVEHVLEPEAVFGAHGVRRVAAAHLAADERTLEMSAEDTSTSRSKKSCGH